MAILRKIIITLFGITILFALVYNVDVKAQLHEDEDYVNYLVYSMEQAQTGLDYSREEIYLDYLVDAVLERSFARD